MFSTFKPWLWLHDTLHLKGEELRKEVKVRRKTKKVNNKKNFQLILIRFSSFFLNNQRKRSRTINERERKKIKLKFCSSFPSLTWWRGGKKGCFWEGYEAQHVTTKEKAKAAAAKKTLSISLFFLRKEKPTEKTFQLFIWCLNFPDEENWEKAERKFSKESNMRKIAQEFGFNLRHNSLEKRQRERALDSV